MRFGGCVIRAYRTTRCVKTPAGSGQQPNGAPAMNSAVTSSSIGQAVNCQDREEKTLQFARDKLEQSPWISPGGACFSVAQVSQLVARQSEARVCGRALVRQARRSHAKLSLVSSCPVSRMRRAQPLGSSSNLGWSCLLTVYRDVLVVAALGLGPPFRVSFGVSVNDQDLVQHHLN